LRERTGAVKVRGFGSPSASARRTSPRGGKRSLLVDAFDRANHKERAKRGIVASIMA
jgi:hypothetical protein